MVADGGPPYLGIGFGENQAKRSGECMFGARFQLAADATLATIAKELNATTKLILDLASVVAGGTLPPQPSTVPPGNGPHPGGR